MLPYQQISDKIKAQRIAARGFGQAFDTFGPGGQPQTPAPAAAQPAATSSTGAVLTGVASIIAPLAQLGVGIVQANMQADLEKKRIKALARQQAASFAAPTYYPPPPPRKSRLPLILGILGGTVGLVVILLLVTKKDDKPKKRRRGRK